MSFFTCSMSAKIVDYGHVNNTNHRELIKTNFRTLPSNHKCNTQQCNTRRKSLRTQQTRCNQHGCEQTYWLTNGTHPSKRVLWKCKLHKRNAQTLVIDGRYQKMCPSYKWNSAQMQHAKKRSLASAAVKTQM